MPYGLPSYLTPGPSTQKEGEDFVVRRSDGTLVSVPYNEAGLFVGMPGRGNPAVITSDPEVRREYEHDAHTRGLQAAGKIAALIGGGAAIANATAGGAGAAAAPTAAPAAAPAYAGATTAAGLPTGAAAAAGGGVGTAAGSVPAVGASPGVGGAAGGPSVYDKIQQFSRIPRGGGGRGTDYNRQIADQMAEQERQRLAQRHQAQLQSWQQRIAGAL